MPRRRVCLYDLVQFALILEQPTGVIYHNQVGGNACSQEDLEGVLVPLHIGEEVEKRIAERLENRMWLSDDDADFVESLFAGNPYITGVKVDRARLRDSCEAWVYVSIEATPAYREPFGVVAPSQRQVNSFYGFDACRGVLTWPNSD